MHEAAKCKMIITLHSVQARSLRLICKMQQILQPLTVQIAEAAQVPRYLRNQRYACSPACQSGARANLHGFSAGCAGLGKCHQAQVKA